MNPISSLPKQWKFQQSNDAIKKGSSMKSVNSGSTQKKNKVAQVDFWWLSEENLTSLSRHQSPRQLRHLVPKHRVVSGTDQIMIGVEVEQEITEGGTEAGCGLKCLRIGKMRLQGQDSGRQAASPLSMHNSMLFPHHFLGLSN